MAAAGAIRGWWRVAARLLPALAGVLTILVLAVVTQRVGAGDLAEAEATRLANRESLVVGLAGHADVAIADGRVQDTTSSMLFALDNPALDTEMLKRFADQHGGYPVSRALLVRPDGSEIASWPAGDAVAVSSFGAQWAQAVAGQTVRTSLFHLGTEPVTATLVPLTGQLPAQNDSRGSGGGRRARTSAVVVAIQPVLLSPLVDYYAGIGSLNDRPGGLTLVDRNGTGVASWNPDLIGTPVLDHDAVARLGTEPSTWTTNSGDREVTWVGAGVGGGFGLVYQQATDDLFGDLRSAQHQRDATLVAVVVVALAALVAFQLWREHGARQAEARIRALMENSQDLVLVCDDAGRLVFVSPAIRRLLLIGPSLWTGRSLSSVCHPDDAAALDELFASPGGRPPLDVRLQGAGDQYRWFDVEAVDVRGVGRLGSVLLTCRELGERKALQDALLYQATHDALTGAVNRTELAARIEALLPDGRPVLPLALLYLDLDGFKPINDAFGHDAGDQVLRAVVRRLVQSVGPAATVCRFGGDELGVLLPGVDDGEARVACDRALYAVRQPIPLGDRSVRVDASIGVVLADPSDTVASPDELIRRADLAMYGAKRAGGGEAHLAPALTDRASRSGRPRPAAGGGLRSSVRAPGRPPPPTGTGGGAPVDARTGRVYAPRRHRRAGLVALAAAAVVVTAIAATGYAQGLSSRQVAESERVAEVNELVVRTAAYYATQTRFDRFATIAANVPFSLDNPAVNELVLRGFANATELGDDAGAALLATDGRRLSAVPARWEPKVRPDSAEWQQTLAGRVTFIPLVNDPDQARSYVLVPVRQNGAVRSVLVLGSSSSRGQVPKLLEAGASAVPGGGWILLDPSGHAFSAWKPELIGEELARPSELSALTPGQSRARVGDDGVLVVAPMPGFLSGQGYLAYWAPEGALFSDLESGPADRGLTLGFVVAAVVIGLALLNMRRERAMRRSESHLDALLQNAHDVIVVFGSDGEVRFISSAIERLLGIPPEGLTSRDLLGLVHPNDRTRVRDLAHSSPGAPAGPARDVRVVAADGSVHVFDVDASDLRGHPAVRGTLLTCHDITERRALQDQVAYRARRDPLTGLPNRASFEEHLDRLGDAAEPFAVLFVDLDHFKPVNDRFGHEAGDEVLRVMAGRLTAAVRQGDVVCRLGGDEFAVVLLEVTEARARATAERIVRLAANPVSVRGATIEIGATVGVALSGPGGDHPQRAVRNADLAMYQAKQAGRGTYALFSPHR